jgi:hypothetical protein
VNSKYGDNVVDLALINKRLAHYDEKRKAKLAHLKEVRAEVLD